MTAKEELLKYRFKMKRVEQTLEDYENFKTRAEKMTAIISETSAHTNKISDKVGDNAIMMAELSKKYETRWKEAEKELNRILELIEKLDDPYRDILYYRYIKFYDLKSVGDKVGYSYDRIKHLHGIALLKYKEVQDEL
jgi:DNA-directed RNA polymerase specialized sigma subunit